MTDFAHRCDISAARAGSFDYHIARDLSPSYCVVEHDMKRWTYHVRRGERSEFRAWLAEVFSGFGTTARVVGQWPFYTIETRS